MIADNIRRYRKANHMSQDELAEKLGVSRQSVGLWENGQTQPTIDNIIALAKIFNTTTDAILSAEPAGEGVESVQPPQESAPAGRRKGRLGRLGLVIAIAAAAAVILGAILYFGVFRKDPGQAVSGGTEVSEQPRLPSDAPSDAPSEVLPTDAPPQPFDLFAYCKDFAIQIGNLRGDYCIYQQPATRYGGYEDEYFSISYWADSDMVEFCLHCPLDETLSINFYLRMRGGYDGKYEYLSSKYYRDTGVSLRYAAGYIDPAVFYDGYPLGCDEYAGSSEGQTEFMEESRVGMCDLIRCLKEFTAVEGMSCSFADFDFVNF